ncbi:MAG: penicillin acylase family protein [Hymenobacter sp.]
MRPAKSASGHALLLINPHTSFYFRSEVQMTSAAGLNAYGAVTWGQFFIYQGFNEQLRLDAHLQPGRLDGRIPRNGDASRMASTTTNTSGQQLARAHRTPSRWRM